MDTKEQSHMMEMMNHMRRQKVRNYHELNQVAVKGQTVCAGRSLMENFPLNELLMDTGSSKRAYNRGIGGLTIEEYDAVLDTCVLELEPSKLIINIGSNDLNLAGNTIGNLIRRYRALIRRIQAQLPACHITMLAFYPCREEPSEGGFVMPGRIPRTMANVNLANEAVRALADELGCDYLDCNAPLLDAEGFLRQELCTDAIHFSPAGYVEVLKILEPYL